MTSKQTAFIGDIHGNLAALNGVIELLLDDPGLERLVFLGDYINRGANSAGVIARLLELAATERVIALRGNHEEDMLAALDSGDLAGFLKKGGASTIRSYLRRPAQPDVVHDFRSAVPSEHVEFLRAMPSVYTTAGLRASHKPDDAGASLFQVSAHMPVGDLPVIDLTSAHLDTNCGSPTGRLTAFFWPSHNYLQVDSRGNLIRLTADES
jgi:calcineurin-like phosphoesterase family protein